MAIFNSKLLNYQRVRHLLKSRTSVFYNPIRAKHDHQTACKTTVVDAVTPRCTPLNPSFPGWWLTYPSEKYEFVSWDDDIPFPTFHGKSIQIPWYSMVPVTTSRSILGTFFPTEIGLFPSAKLTPGFPKRCPNGRRLGIFLQGFVQLVGVLDSEDLRDRLHEPPRLDKKNTVNCTKIPSVIYDG